MLPTNSLVRLLVTSADVIHSWAVPSLGVKIDAIPGRLNQVRQKGGGVLSARRVLCALGSSSRIVLKGGRAGAPSLAVRAMFHLFSGTDVVAGEF